jgi:RND family efflux transporter MFP subunit
MNKFIFIVSLISVFFIGCDDHHHEKGDNHYTKQTNDAHHAHDDDKDHHAHDTHDSHHKEDKGDHEADAHAHHDEGELEAIAVTHYTKETELFVEFEPFVRNRASTFLAHFTTLKDFKPVAKAKVTACLEYQKDQKECFSNNEAKVAGIFKPVATPTHSGEAMLSITIELEEKTIVHKLGKYRVYASINDLPKEKSEENHLEISYLKEQQWKVDFATQVAQKRPMRQSSATFATVELPSNAKQVVSASLSGVVVAVDNLKIGSKVKAGDIIAYIVPTLARGEDSATLEFEYTKAKSKLKLAKSEKDRIDTLYKQKAISYKRLEEAKQNYEVAKAAFESIEKKRLRLNPTHAKNGIALKSYISGEIVAIHQFNGSYVQEGDVIMQIADTSKVWLRAGVAQSELAKVNNPTGIELVTTDKNLIFNQGQKLKLLSFSQLIDPKTRKAYFVFELDNTQTQLKIGAIYSAKVYANKPNYAISVAKSAIVNHNGEDVVFVQTGGESFERRLVEIGESDNGYVKIRLGVQEGERIVTQGAYRVMLAALAPADIGHGHAH